jgi:hypothetical protein
MRVSHFVARASAPKRARERGWEDWLLFEPQCSPQRESVGIMAVAGCPASPTSLTGDAAQLTDAFAVVTFIPARSGTRSADRERNAFAFLPPRGAVATVAREVRRLSVVESMA